MRRYTKQAYMRRTADTERRVDEAVAAVRTERDAEWDAAKARTATARAAHRTFTREDLEGAGFIHDGLKWRKVIRLNAKTVTVDTAYSWTERVPFSRIIAAQPALEG